VIEPADLGALAREFPDAQGRHVQEQGYASSLYVHDPDGNTTTRPTN
jgi:hypothetical protein